MSDVLDLLVIGGGVMGLFTAHQAAVQGARVTVLERGRIGDPMTASFGRTRSYRRDYLDATYARFADEAIRLWGEFEGRTGTEVLVRCGCLNIAQAAVNPDLGPLWNTSRRQDIVTRLLAELELGPLFTHEFPIDSIIARRLRIAQLHTDDSIRWRWRYQTEMPCVRW